MPFSSGTFSVFTPGTPYSAGNTISSSVANSVNNDFATGLSSCVLKDGSQTMTASLPMANFKLTGLGAGTALTDSANLQQVQYGFGSFLTSVAGTNTVTATATPTPAYTVGQRFTFIPAVTNTSAVTLNISSVGAGAVQWAGAALTGGELVAGTAYTVYVTAATPVFELVGATQFPDTRALVVGGTDATKKIRFEADGITTGTTRVVTMPDADVTLLTGAATQAEQETGSITTAAVTPGRQHFHQSAAKAWVQFDQGGGLTASYNVTSVTDNSAGNWSPVWATDFSTANYSMVATAEAPTSATTATTYVIQILSRAAGGCNVVTQRVSDAAQTDIVYVNMAAYGDQA